MMRAGGRVERLKRILSFQESGTKWIPRPASRAFASGFLVMDDDDDDDDGDGECGDKDDNDDGEADRMPDELLLIPNDGGEMRDAGGRDPGREEFLKSNV